jgi:ribosomal protein S12 methylthiotransferase
VTPTKAVYFVSLGCPKNRVDSEVMLGHLARDGYSVVARPEDADVIVVNTCGFIDAAKQESIDAILEMARHRSGGRAKKLVVAGCLSQRYAPDLAKEIPEVDHFLGTGNVESITAVLGGKGSHRRGALPIVGQDPAGDGRSGGSDAHAHVATVSDAHAHAVAGDDGEHRQARSRRRSATIDIPDPDFTLNAASPRLMTRPPHSAYVKIAEGCSNGCAFCIIPQLRGPQHSRPIDDIVHEVERLLAGGCVEVNLIAQDLCAYGKDLEPRQSLAQLLRALDRLGSGREHFWIRCLYAYPRGLTRELIEVLAEARHVLKYLDMPLQHIADPILRRMRRGKGGAATWELVRRLRASIPDLVLRTTFITGLPGETAADFAELCDFVREIRFERMGVFAYSREEDTPAAGMPNQVPAELAAERRDALMALQRDISRAQQRALLGRTLAVLVEGVSDETELLLEGRHGGQAPEIDGVTYITDGTASPGEVVRIRVDQAGDYDVAGGIVAGSDGAAPLDLLPGRGYQ